MKLTPIVILLSFLLLTGCAKEEKQPATTLLLLRHAEKVNDSSDNPQLTAVGKLRSIKLRNTLLKVDLAAIYSTPYQRNVATVKPLADTLDLVVNEYDQKLDLSNFMATILQKHKGQKVLICGHSSTIPGMLNVAVGENTYENLKEGEYDDLFIVSIPENGKTVVTHLKLEAK